MKQPVSQSLPVRMLDRASAWSPFVIALAVFLLLRPYDGIVHDARLYVGYVLAAWDPQDVGQDILFAYDGQSGFTLYPYLLRLMAESFGMATGAKLLSSVSILAWFVAGCRLVGSLLDDYPLSVRLGALVWGTTLHTMYGGGSAFRFAENFATPRPVSEALVLLSTSLIVDRVKSGGGYIRLFDGKVVLSLLLLTLAVAVHPLMVAPGIAVFTWVTVSPKLRLWFVVTLVSFIACMLVGGYWTSAGGQLGILIATIDKDWHDVLVRRGSITLSSQWYVRDWVRILAQILTLLLARRSVKRELHVIWDVVVFAGATSVVLTWLASGVFHHSLLTQLQPWRTLWFAGLLSGVGMFLLVREAFLLGGTDSESKVRQVDRLLIVMLLLVWSMIDVSIGAAWFLLCASIVAAASRFQSHPALSDRTAIGIVWIIAASILALIVVRAYVVWEVYSSHPQVESRITWHVLVTSGIPSTVVLVATALIARSRKREWPLDRHLVRALPALCSLSFIFWLRVSDQRSNYARWLEDQIQRTVDPGMKSTTIPGENAVLWLDGDLEPWVLLKRPSWGGLLQGTPTVFDRRLAMRWEARAAQIDEITHPNWARRSDIAFTELKAEVLSAICQWPDAPTVVVAPLDRISADLPRDTIRAGAPRYLPPNVRKGPWYVTTAYGVIRCERRVQAASES